MRLESPEENPEERTGSRHPDLLAWVRQERPRLTVAAMTILRGYCVAGRPDMGLTPWRSFEGWSDLVRQSIVWCGLPDPGETRQELAGQAGVPTVMAGDHSRAGRYVSRLLFTAARRRWRESRQLIQGATP